MELLSIGSSTCFDHIFELEKIPELGETVEFNFPDLNEIDKTFFGGIAFNSGVMASSLGIEVECVYFVGGDFYRRGYYSYLRDRGIPCQGIIEVGGKHCGHCFLFHDRQGRDFKIINTGASRYADEFDPDRSLIKQAEMVMVSPVLNDFSLKNLRIARELGKKTTINGFVRYRPESFLRLADYIFMNNHELQELMSNIGTDNTKDIFELGPKILFITMGGQGSRVITPDNTVTIPAIKPPEIQDTTGAGDAFVGGAVAALLQNRSPAVAARFGSTASSFIIEKTGCQTNIPDQAGFIERYQKNFGQL